MPEISYQNMTHQQQQIVSQSKLDYTAPVITTTGVPELIFDPMFDNFPFNDWMNLN